MILQLLPQYAYNPAKVFTALDATGPPRRLNQRLVSYRPAAVLHQVVQYFKFPLRQTYGESVLANGPPFRVQFDPADGNLSVIGGSTLPRRFPPPYQQDRISRHAGGDHYHATAAILPKRRKSFATIRYREHIEAECLEPGGQRPA